MCRVAQLIFSAQFLQLLLTIRSYRHHVVGELLASLAGLTHPLDHGLRGMPADIAADDLLDCFASQAMISAITRVSSPAM